MKNNLYGSTENNKKIMVLYHANCLDGFTAAWVAWKKFGDLADYIPVAHQRTPPGDFKDKEVYFVDFAYPVETTKRILEEANKVVIIDHHKTTKDSAELAHDHLYSENNSGAVLAWQYFFSKIPTPKLLKYVEDMDLWNFKLDGTEEVIAFMDKERFDFERWNDLVDNFESGKDLKGIIKIGENLLEYKRSILEKISYRSYKVNFEKKDILAINSPIFQSELGHILYERIPPMSIVWYEKNNEIKVSLRSDGSVDVGKIAEKYGGGGHKEASAFRIDNHKKLPWKILEDKRM